MRTACRACARADLAKIDARSRDSDSVDVDFASLDSFETIDGFDKRRFSRTGRTAHDDHLAYGHLCAAVGQHAKGTVPLTDIFNLDHLDTSAGSVRVPRGFGTFDEARCAETDNEIDDCGEHIHLHGAAVASRDLGSCAEEISHR